MCTHVHYVATYLMGLPILAHDCKPHSLLNQEYIYSCLNQFHLIINFKINDYLIY